MIKQILGNWKKFAQKAGDVQTSLFFLGFYLIIFLSLGLIFGLLVDSFRSKKPYSSQWLNRKKKRFLLEDLIAQY